MKTRATWVAVAVMATALGGCRKRPEAAASPEAPATTLASDSAVPPESLAPAEPPPPTAAPNTMPPGRSLLSVHVGIGGDSENGLSTGQVGFPVGTSLTAAVDVSVQAAGSMVKATWLRADGGTLGEAHQSVAPGQRWMLFAAPNSGGWSEGTYQVDVTSSSGGSASRAFQIEARGEEAPTREPG